MIDTDELKSRIFYGLQNNSLSAENWEEVISSAMGARWIPGDKYLADGVLDNFILNIKTVKMSPTLLKTKASRDFLSHPEHFPVDSQMLIQRRASLPHDIDERTAAPGEVGRATLEDFRRFERQSFDHFGCDTTLDVVVRHGIDRSQQWYQYQAFISHHRYHDADRMDWREVLGGARSAFNGVRTRVKGFENGQRRVARNSASTSSIFHACMVIYKDLTDAIFTVSGRMPIPAALTFDRQRVLAEIAALEQGLACSALLER